MEIIRVMLVDNEAVFREGLNKLLKEQPHIQVVYQCGDGKEAIEKSMETRPDVILMDSQIPEHDVLETVKKIKGNTPDIKVAIITRLGIGPNPVHILKAGARACLAKNISPLDLIKSIELISSGRIIISPLFADEFLNEMNSAENTDNTKPAEAKCALTDRELEIVVLIAEGNTNKEIASKLFIAENTVKVHVKNILNKLELRNRQQLAAYAVLQNWVTNTVQEKEDNSLKS
jgi:DNA-binding NarL/FixJ family response regulator